MTSTLDASTSLAAPPLVKARESTASPREAHAKTPALEGPWINVQDDVEASLVADVAAVLGEEPLRRLGIYRLPADFCLSVVIPVYNEQATIDEVLQRVRAVPIPKEIVIVDDCSTDETQSRLAAYVGQPDIKVVYHLKNQGKGAALRTALRHVTGSVVLFQDADLEYDPADYPRLLQPIVDGRADVVFGSRYLGEVIRTQPFWHRQINRLLTLASNMCTNLNLTDMETCYKVFRRDVLQGLTIEQNRFGVEPELTAKIARRKCRIYELPVSYSGRSYQEGKKIGLRDAFQAVYCIVRYGWRD